MKLPIDNHALSRRSFGTASLRRLSFTRALRFSVKLLLISAVSLVATSSNAYAYIDPGYGSLLWQLLIAGFFGALFYARGIISRVKAWFGTIIKRAPGKGDQN